MNTLREEIEKILLKNHMYLHYGMLMHVRDLDGAKEIRKEILSLIRKELLENMPKVKTCGGDLQMNDEYEQCHGYNQALSEIKDILEKELK